MGCARNISRCLSVPRPFPSLALDAHFGAESLGSFRACFLVIVGSSTMSLSPVGRKTSSLMSIGIGPDASFGLGGPVRGLIGLGCWDRAGCFTGAVVLVGWGYTLSPASFLPFNRVCLVTRCAGYTSSSSASYSSSGTLEEIVVIYSGCKCYKIRLWLQHALDRLYKWFLVDAYNSRSILHNELS